MSEHGKGKRPAKKVQPLAPLPYSADELERLKQLHKVGRTAVEKLSNEMTKKQEE